MKKQQDASPENARLRHFSVVDLLILLVFSLLLTVFIYFYSQGAFDRAAEAQTRYTVTVNAEIEDWQEKNLPEENERIFDKTGKVSGKVLNVQTVEHDGWRVAQMTLLWTGEEPTGDVFFLETQKIILETELLEVRQEEGEGA